MVERGETLVVAENVGVVPCEGVSGLEDSGDAMVAREDRSRRRLGVVGGISSSSSGTSGSLKKPADRATTCSYRK